MTPDEIGLGAAFILGLAGSTHCLGMCGGYSASLGLSVNSTAARKAAYGLLFNTGRICCYALLGLLVGIVGQFLGSMNESLPFFKLLRVVSGFLLIAMALYVSRLWMGLAAIEKLGQGLWKRLSPASKLFFPMDSPFKALGLGFLWGFLPCGLVYSALAFAALSANSLQSALLMFCFGLGTVPAMFTVHSFSSAAKSLLQKKNTRYAMAILLFAFGFWTIMGNTGSHQGHAGHESGHAGHQSGHEMNRSGDIDSDQSTEHNTDHSTHDQHNNSQ